MAGSSLMAHRPLLVLRALVLLLSSTVAIGRAECDCGESASVSEPGADYSHIFKARVKRVLSGPQVKYRLANLSGLAHPPVLDLEVLTVYRGKVPPRAFIGLDIWGSMSICTTPNVAQDEVRIFFLRVAGGLPYLGVCGKAPLATEPYQVRRGPVTSSDLLEPGPACDGTTANAGHERRATQTVEEKLTAMFEGRVPEAGPDLGEGVTVTESGIFVDLGTGGSAERLTESPRTTPEVEALFAVELAGTPRFLRPHRWEQADPAPVSWLGTK